MCGCWSRRRARRQAAGAPAGQRPALRIYSAALAIAPLQDVLNLGNEARMNRPGSAEGNWRWRCTGEMLSAPGFDSLKTLTRASGRAGAPTEAPS